MPCRDYRDDHPELYERELQEDINLLTRMLCSLCRSHPVILEVAEVAKWYRLHEEADRIHREMEEIEEKRKRKVELETLRKLLAKYPEEGND